MMEKQTDKRFFQALDQIYFKKSARSITAWFFVLGCVWIVCSDLLLFLAVPGSSSYLELEMLKGIAFVSIASVLVYFLADRKMKQLHDRFLSDRLEDVQSLLETLQENLGEAVFIVDSKTRTIRSCNNAAINMFGHSQEELLGENTRKLHISDESYNQFAHLSETELKKQQVFRCRFGMKRKDGTPFATENTVIALDEDTGWEHGVVSIVRDISERVKARSALRISERRHRLLAMNTLDIIWEMTPDLVFTYVNPAITTILGYTPSEFVGSSLHEHVNPEDLNKLKNIIQAEIEKGPEGTGVIVTTNTLHKDGAPIPVEVHGRVLFSKQGKPIAIQGTTRDITQRLAMEAQLRQSQKLQAIGTFAGGVAHEINNPMQGITGFAELISQASSANPKIRGYCQEINEQTQRVHALVQDLLGYAHVDKAGTSSKELALHKVVESTLSLARTIIRHDKIKLNVAVPNDLPPMLGHRQQIQQVVMNLVTNARDALNSRYPDANENKRIDLSATSTEYDGNRFVRLIVEDRGTGMPEEVQARIFEPFFTTKPTGKGTGLGMWIIHRIVEDHDGRISIESIPGEFTRFSIDFPVADVAKTNNSDSQA